MAPEDAVAAAQPPEGIRSSIVDDTQDGGTNTVDLQQATMAEKRKRKSKSFAARGPTGLPKRCGTGFEEYYAEPPLTIHEYEEELDLYHATLSFNERIETCIQRYRARRRLDNERTNIFNHYLKLGGIDCTPRMFNGAAGFEEGEAMTKDDVRALTATDVVPHAGSKMSRYYAADNDHMWTVDFTGVVSGFLSVSLRALGGCNERLMIVGIDVVDNFLRYLLLHDVCPEYDKDVKAARAVCAQARTELPHCLRALARLPGQFNLACAKLFCNKPEHAVFDDGLDPLRNVASKDWDAAHVFRANVELQDKVMGSEALRMARDDLDGIRIVRTREAELEIARLIKPSKSLQERYSAVAEAEAKAASGTGIGAGSKSSAASEPDVDSNAVKLTGVAITKAYSIEEGIANQPHPTDEELESQGRDAFFLDAETMDLLCVGMKMRVVLHELNCDLHFISAVKELLPSFYLFLPQELMLDWKEPKANEREAPSVDNPYAEEDAAEKEMMDDDKESVC